MIYTGVQSLSPCAPQKFGTSINGRVTIRQKKTTVEKALTMQHKAQLQIHSLQSGNGYILGWGGEKREGIFSSSPHARLDFTTLRS